MKILVSILCHNRADSTRKCLEAVLVPYQHDVRFLITDNASTDETAAILGAITDERVQVVTNETNEGFIAPNNRAFETAVDEGFDYFVLLNNDTVPPADWLERLIEPFSKHKTAALSGPQGKCSHVAKDGYGHPGPFDYIEGACLCVKVDVVKLWMPLFSTYLQFAYGEDSDLSLRMKELGYTIHRVQLQVQHVGNATTKNNSQLRRLCDEYSAKNHETIRQRWRFFLKTRRFGFPIIVRRAGACGDVLLTTPIIASIRKTHPQSPVFVVTDTPEVVQSLPGVRVQRVFRRSPHDVVVNLDGAYETRPNMHYVRAYEQAARAVLPSLAPVELKTTIVVPQSVSSWAALRRAHIGGERLCAMHVGPTGWTGRDWPKQRFAEVAERLKQSGWQVLLVGKQPVPEITGCHNLTAQTTFRELAAILQACQMFVGIDSFPMHVAQAVGCPAVGIFGVSHSDNVMTDSSPHIGVNADANIPCAGSRHRLVGKTFVNCSPDCINSVTVDQVMEAINKLIP